MNYFHMSYKQVLKSPMQRLIMLAKSIPKHDTGKKQDNEEEKLNLFDFAKQNNLLRE